MPFDVDVTPDIWTVISSLSTLVTAIISVAASVAAWIVWARNRFLKQRPILQVARIDSRGHSLVVKNTGGRAAKIITSVATDEGVDYPDMLGKGRLLDPGDMAAIRFTRGRGVTGWTLRLSYAERDEDFGRYDLTFAADW